MKVLVVAEHLRRPVPAGIGTYATGLLDGLIAMARSPEGAAAAGGAGSAADPGPAEAGGAGSVADPGPADSRMGRGSDVEVTLLAGRRRRRDQSVPDPLARWPWPVAETPLPGRGTVRLWDSGMLQPKVPHDVMHAVSQAFPRPVAPMSVMVHDLSYRHHPSAFPPRGRRWHEASLRRALRQAAVIVTPSEATAADLREEGASRVEVVEHGADHLPAPDHEAAAALLSGHGVKGPYLLSVGTQEPRKNLARVLVAYSSIRSRLPEPWPLVVVGPPGWGAGVAPAGQDVARVEGVVPVGRVDDPVLAGLYAGARCLVYMPLLEGFGLPPVEAMSLGVPVAASPMPSSGGAALEADPLDTEAMGEAMLAAAGDESVRAKLVEAGRRRAGTLTWERSARQHVEIWRSLC